MMKFTTIAQARKDTYLSYIGSVNKSAKLAKNGKISGQYTYGIYLSPANTSGYNVCSHSTPECRMSCLATSGRAGMELLSGKTKTHNCRVNKTRLFFEETAYFMAWMIAEIRMHMARAQKDGFGFSVRLNCTSDIDWQKVLVDGKNIFRLFSEVLFYDYTKNPAKFNELPRNYHLTFSYTGKNAQLCEVLLKRGHNVAVVFDVKRHRPLPETFYNYKVVDGDLTDYRPDDSKGVIIGLRFKQIADRQAMKKAKKSCFVINPAKLQLAMSNVQI